MLFRLVSNNCLASCRFFIIFIGILVLFVKGGQSEMAKISEKDAVIFYVAPNGKDTWTGRLSEPNSSKNDGPFATIQKARDAIRELKQQQDGKLKQSIIVYIRGGKYFLDEPIIFTSKDSGTSECSITYKNYQDEEVTISGGRKISEWSKTKVNDKPIWVTEVNELDSNQLSFRQIWVNSERAKRARYPNKGYLKVGEVPDTTSESPWNKGQNRFRFQDGDLKEWKTLADAEVVLMSRWIESHLPIVSIDENERIVNFDRKSVFIIAPGDQYYVENALEFVDEPGEWYLDHNNKKIYYLPMPDEDINQSEVIIPVLKQLIRFEGNLEKEKLVEYISFQGINFSHTEWSLPKEQSGYPQAAVGVPGAVYGEGVCNCIFENCNFSNLGTYAIELSRGCKQNKIRGCEISDLGAGGIKIGETAIRDNDIEQTHNNEIVDCYIHDGGVIFHSAIGIWIGQSYNNLIAHNHIHDFYYTGISIGWTWGYGKALARGNIVEYNHIHNIGIKSDGDGPILSDMGGIYTLGTQTGTIIRFNIFHDIAGYRYGGWGIYFDEGSTQIVAENNLVYRTTHGGFHQHYGKENIVRNNIFAFGRDAQIQMTRPEPHTRFTIERNIIYWDNENLFAGNLGEFHFVFENNLYWRQDNQEIKFGNLNWDEWRAKGMDKNSLIADPLFLAPEEDNFSLKPDSPAKKIGFIDIDLSECGIRE